MLNFKKLNPEQINAMANKQRMQKEFPAYNKTSWFTAPEGLQKFEIPKIEGAVRMDVLAFPMKGLINKDLADVGEYDTRESVHWNQSIMVHECFPATPVVCNKTFDLRRANNDVVCNTCWDDKSFDFKKASKRYTFLLLRLHPNEELGITDYTFMYSLETHGKFGKPMFEEWSKVAKRKDAASVEMSHFYEWDETGYSVEVYFSKLTSNNGFEYWGTNDISFVPRADALTEADVEFIQNLDLPSCIHKPTEEEYNTFHETFLEKGVRRNGYVKPEAPMETVVEKQDGVTVQKTFEEPPKTVTRDATFSNPVKDSAFGEETKAESDEDFWDK